jgi:hypothetical protein
MTTSGVVNKQCNKSSDVFCNLASYIGVQQWSKHSTIGLNGEGIEVSSKGLNREMSSTHLRTETSIFRNVVFSFFRTPVCGQSPKTQ